MATFIITSPELGCTRMITWAIVAGGASSRSAGVIAVGVAGGTSDAGMPPSERISGGGVVEGGGPSPRSGIVAGCAVSALRSVVSGIRVAGGAGSRYARVVASNVAHGAGYACMGPGQGEGARRCVASSCGPTP